jgi:predicted RNase H-like HicB family nuclease
MKYLVVFEKTAQSFGAYVPDLPGCVATATSHEEVSRLIHEAIDLHLQDLQAQGLPVPIPNSAAELVEVINH